MATANYLTNIIIQQAMHLDDIIEQLNAIIELCRESGYLETEDLQNWIRKKINPPTPKKPRCHKDIIDDPKTKQLHVIKQHVIDNLTSKEKECLKTVFGIQVNSED